MPPDTAPLTSQNTDFIATFMFSTGRCASQWLAECLAASEQTATVVHEAWQDHALTRRLLSGDEPSQVEGGERLLAHAERIEAALQQGPYFETGFPVWTALSWVSRGAWLPSLFPGSPPGRVLLSAEDKGVQHRQYREPWVMLSAYDKALFYWAEVQAAALKLENDADCPWLRLKFEDLFSDEGTRQLTTFLQIPNTLLGTEEREQPVDQWPFLLRVPTQWQSIANHAAVLDLCERLAYDPMQVDTVALQQRFGSMVI